MERRADALERDHLVGEIGEFGQALGVGRVGGNDFVAFVVALLAHLRGDDLDRAEPGQIERGRRQIGQPEIIGAGGDRLDDGARIGIGPQVDIEAFRL